MTELEFQQFKEFIDKLKSELLTLEDYENIFLELGGSDVIYKQDSNEWILKTMCHNVDLIGVKNKLYFYPDDHNLTCYTECSCSMDIIELVRKRFELIGEPKTLVQSVKWICNICNIPFKFKDDKILPKKDIYNWKSKLNKYIKRNKEEIELKIWDDNILNYFIELYHTSWIEDNISIESMEKYGIKYYARLDAIVIPCRDIEGNLIGIRVRFLNPELEYKYLPLKLLDGTEYKFPTNQILYGIWFTKSAIRKYKKAVIFESEKSTLQCDTYFGKDNFSVSLYGKAMSEEKRNMLIELGVNEVIIAIDWDYEVVGYEEDGVYKFTKEFEKYQKKVYSIGEWFKGFCKVTVLISYQGHRIHDSPSDRGKEKYLEIYNEREELY